MAPLSFSSNIIDTMDELMCNHTSSAFDIIAAMCHQEKTLYNNKVDFLAGAKNRRIRVRVDEECRYNMAQWCYEIYETYQLTFEVVEVAMTMFDRFLATPAGVPALESRRTFELACITCLYTAVKAHETKFISPQTISTLSNGLYNKEDVVQMESTILTALQFRVHPPTTMSFVRSYLDVLVLRNVLPSRITSEQQQVLLDLSALQARAAVSSYQFVTAPASVIGYYCLVNSLKALGLIEGINDRSRVNSFFSPFVSHADARKISKYGLLLCCAISSNKNNIYSAHRMSMVRRPEPTAQSQESPKAVTIE